MPTKKKPVKKVVKKSVKKPMKKAVAKVAKKKPVLEQMVPESAILYRAITTDGFVDPIELDLEAQAAEFNDIEDVIDSADMGIVHVSKHDDGEPLAFADRVDKDQTIVYVIDESSSMSGKMEPEVQGFVDNDLVAHNPDIEVAANTISEPVTRNQCMKDAMKKFVEQRFTKYPGSKVAVIGFAYSPTIRCEAGASKENVLNAISMLHASGGTRIYDAVVAGLNQVVKSPSPMRANHIILVSDGEDYTASDVEKLLPTMRKNDIVFDFIFIKGHGSMIDPDIRKMLEKVTRQTGGDYFEVTKASDFEQKFFEVSHRLCLPVGR